MTQTPFPKLLSLQHLLFKKNLRVLLNRCWQFQISSSRCKQRWRQFDQRLERMESQGMHRPSEISYPTERRSRSRSPLSRRFSRSSRSSDLSPTEDKGILPIVSAPWNRLETEDPREFKTEFLQIKGNAGQ